MSQESSTRIGRKFIFDVFLLAALTFSIYLCGAIWIPFERGFFCGDESLMYPYKDDTITVFVLKFVGVGLPILTFLVCEWILLRKDSNDRRVWNLCIPAWLQGFYYPLASFSFGTCFLEITVFFAKVIIGRPRPHFFDLCQPSVDCNLPQWQHRYIETHEYDCLGQHHKLEDVHMSFLSGHSAWAAYTMFYLAFYLEKRMVWSGTRGLRHTLQFVVIMWSWFTALSRVTDYKHHWSDVLAGYSFGLALAILVWTWATDIYEPKKKHNHLPLHDSTPIQQIQTAISA